MLSVGWGSPEHTPIPVWVVWFYLKKYNETCDQWDGALQNILQYRFWMVWLCSMKDITKHVICRKKPSKTYSNTVQVVLLYDRAEKQKNVTSKNAL